MLQPLEPIGLELDITITQFYSSLLELPKSVVWPVLQESQDTIVGFGFDRND